MLEKITLDSYHTPTCGSKELLEFYFLVLFYTYQNLRAHIQYAAQMTSFLSFQLMRYSGDQAFFLDTPPSHQENYLNYRLN